MLLDEFIPAKVFEKLHAISAKDKAFVTPFLLDNDLPPSLSKSSW